MHKMEKQPLKPDKANPEGSEAYWQHFFLHLSELDGEVEEGKPPSIHIKKLKRYIKQQSSYEIEETTGLPKTRLLYIANRLTKADTDKDGKITSHEWQSFLMKHGQDILNENVAGGMLRVLAYAPVYTCSPPALFLLAITAAQITCYCLSIFSPEKLGISYSFGETLWPIDSFLIYDPYKRKEAWRFVSYMFLHGSHEHIIFNCIIQLIVGIPLEMSQLGWRGSLRLAGLYSSGVALGALGATVAEPKKYMLGASAGVYALIAAHLATLILNWNEDGQIYAERKKRAAMDHDHEIPPSQRLNPWIRGLRLTFIIIFTAFDVGTAVYKVYVLKQESSTSYSGHAFGALAGLLIGIFLLENRKVESWERIFQWIALIFYFIVLLVCVAWHIVGTETGWFPDPNDDPFN